MFRFVIILVLAMLAEGTARALSCVPSAFDAPTNIAIPTGEALPGEQGWAGGTGGSTTGSLRWFPAPNPDPAPGCDPYQIEVASSDGQIATHRDFVAERQDADATAWRLPSDVNVGDNVYVIVTCRGSDFTATTFADGTTIIEGPTTTGTTPTLGALSTQRITRKGGCGVAEGSSATLISAPVTADEQVLLDGWIVPQGDSRPLDEAPRAADKVPVALVDGQLFFRVEMEGAFTVFVQVTDVATAQSSSIEQIDFENPPPSTTDAVPKGCSATPPDGVLLSCAVLLGLAVRRRRSVSLQRATA